MFAHVPVLLHEALDYLNVRDGGTYVDLTLGRAGHSSEILKRIPNGKLIAFDQDPEAIIASQARLGLISNNFLTVRENFSHISQVLEEQHVKSVDGILMDLGVSSPQLDEAERGFSYKEEAKLDMRMDPDNALTAWIVVNEYPLQKLRDVISKYGEDKDAYLIARKIVQVRENSPIETTTQLAEIIKSAKPKAELFKKGHPAKQSFQAIRMEVNHEESCLEAALREAPNWLSSQGRLVVISFMSLDDRMVKQRFRELSVVEGDRHGMDVLPEDIKKPSFRLLTKKPVEPSLQEIKENHRSASAKLRAIERI